MITWTQLPEDALLCRTAGHAWDEYHDHDLPRPLFGVRQAWRCTRCGTQRLDIIDRLGQVASRRYVYRTGYRDVEERPRRQDLRLELLRRRGVTFSKRRREREAS